MHAMLLGLSAGFVEQRAARGLSLAVCRLFSSRQRRERSRAAAPARASAAADLPAAGAAASAAAAAAQHGAPRPRQPPQQELPSGAHARFSAQWRELLGHLWAGGHFEADQARLSPGALESDKGACKRAVLSFARQRPDLRHKLPEPELRAMVEAGFPRPDRKSINAYKRLEASIIRGRDLPPGDGGPADFQDVMRQLYALSVVDPVTAELESPGLAAAACELMPGIIAASQEEQSRHRASSGSLRGSPRPAFASSQRRAAQEAAGGQPRRGASAARRQTPAGGARRQGGMNNADVQA